MKKFSPQTKGSTLTGKSRDEMVSGLEKTEIKKIKVRVVGIGGGGSNIVSELSKLVKKANFFAANTDLQSLKKISQKVKIFPFGQNLTQGMGTGMNPELAEMAALQEKERIKKLFQNQDLVILVASLGGGTGSGALPVFAKISRSLGNLTYGIFTLPFEFEGEKKKEIAKVALEKVKSKLNALTIIPNDKIFQVIERTKPLKEALSFINKNLALSLGGLIEIIYQPGLINIDFADLKTILEDQGRFAFLSTIEGSFADQETEIVKKIIHNPLYPYTIKGAKGVLFNISGEKELLLSDVAKISESISQLVNPEAKIIFGLSQDKVQQFYQQKPVQDKIRVTLLATGCSFRIFEDKDRLVVSKRIAPIERKKESFEILSEEALEIKKEPEKLPKEKKVEKESVRRKMEKNKKDIKIKVKISSESELKKISQSPESEEKLIQDKTKEMEEKVSSGQTEEKVEIKVRKNALQIKKEIEKAEKEILEREKFWETPPFLRRKSKINI